MEIGERLKALRLRRGLTQEELASRCELSKGFISLLERDLTSPSIATLDDILECLGCDLPTFFAGDADDKLVYSEEDTYTKADEETLKGSIRWLIPTAQKNAMEPIMVEMDEGGSTETDSPHEGEEFGYVLTGVLQLEIGERKLKVRKGESFYFKSTAPHRLINAGKNPCRILWVSTPPSF